MMYYHYSLKQQLAFRSLIYKSSKCQQDLQTLKHQIQDCAHQRGEHLFFLVLQLRAAIFHKVIMGNSNSRSSDLIIYIQTQKQYYNSGSFIEGVVFVQAKKNFQFDALYLRAEGDEWCQWFEGSSKNRQKHTGSQNFYSTEHLLQNYKGTLEAGRYAYPFSIELSQNIPGSFESSEFEAKISYKLAAYFVNYKMKENRQIEYIPIHIREPFRQEIVSYQGVSEQSPTSCGCFQKGSVSLQARFDRNVCYEGESISIEVKVDNSKGTDKIDHVLIDLVQNVFVCSNTGVHRTFRTSIYEQKVPVLIQKGETQSITHSFKVNSKQGQTSIGTLVANHYRIEVSTNSGYVSSQNPCIFSPLFIIKQKDIGCQNVARPPNLSQNLSDYNIKKLQVFKAPEHWFKKNLNLSVMNFRLQDGLETV